MNLTQQKNRAVRAQSNITVIVEDADSSAVRRRVSCGTDQCKANLVEDGFLERFDLEKYHVYQQHEVAV